MSELRLGQKGGDGMGMGVTEPRARREKIKRKSIRDLRKQFQSRISHGCVWKRDRQGRYKSRLGSRL